MTDKKVVTLERGWGLLLRDAGIEPENVLRRAQLPLTLLTEEQVRVTPEDYFKLWNALEVEVDDATLPILIGKAATPEAFHPSIFAALCSPNLRIAAKRIGEYKKLIAPITLIITGSETEFSVQKKWDDPAIVPPKSMAMTELVFLTQIARIGTRERICPIKVESPFVVEAIPDYESFFGVVPVESKKNRVTFTAEDADRPFLTASEVMWKTFEPELQRRISKLEASARLNERVRSVLLETLPSGETSVEAASRRLGVSVRTLQRTLKEEGTSYKEIVRNTREQLARHYVSNTNLNYAEISFLIGFEEPSSFFRAFRDWTGETPEGVRQARVH